MLELLAVMALIAILVMVTTSDLLGAQRKRDFENFAREILVLLESCRWKALNEGAYAGVVVKPWNDEFYASLYLDGNRNGIRLNDIDLGIDIRFRGPVILQRGQGDVKVGFLTTPVPQIPPRSGWLDTSDPVRFGKSDIISFSPWGDSSSGTIYLACQSQVQMYAIVAYGATARLNLWRFSNDQWQMVGDR